MRFRRRKDAGFADRPIRPSLTEDTRTTSNAGQLLSLPVRIDDEYAASAKRVVDALPRWSAH
ncbi:MAG: hypothetical protein U0744_10970 [Gemmataceae bacterium]